jgi:hypothetical protein
LEDAHYVAELCQTELNMLLGGIKFWSFLTIFIGVPIMAILYGGEGRATSLPISRKLKGKL